MKVGQKSEGEERGTVALHVVDAHPDERGHGAALPLAQAGQAAAKHLVWRHHKRQGRVTEASRSSPKSARDNVLRLLKIKCDPHSGTETSRRLNSGFSTTGKKKKNPEHLS